MKTFILLLLCLFSTHLFSNENEYFRAKNLHFNYQNLNGILQASEISFLFEDQKLNETNIIRTVKVTPEEIIIIKGEEELILPNNFHETITGIENIKIDELFLDYDENDSSGSFNKIYLNNGGETSITNVSFYCSKKGTRDILNNIFETCLNNGELMAQKLILENSTGKVFKKTFKARKDTIIKDFKLTTDKGNFNLTCKYSLKIKAKGFVEYRDNDIVITLKSVKAGWLNVKKTVLKEIDEANIEEVTVSGDRIFIKLD